MIILAANGQSVTVTMDTIQAKAMMHVLRYSLDDPAAEAEIYAAERMAETGLPIHPRDLMLLVGQVVVTMGRILTEAEAAAEAKLLEAQTGQAEHIHDESCPEHPDNKKETKGKTTDGDWKN